MSFEVCGQRFVLRPACECRLCEQVERERRARLEHLSRSLRRQGLEDGRYAGMRLDTWCGRDACAEAAMTRLRAYFTEVRRGTRNWLYLYGGYGLGKTHLGVAALKHLCLDRRWESLLLRWSQYCSRIQQSWHDPDAASESQLWGRAAESDLLVCDDIDKRGASEWALGKLFELIDHRYLRQLPTVLIANRSLEALPAFWNRNDPMRDLATAIVSRIVGQLAAAIEFAGPDRRFPPP